MKISKLIAMKSSLSKSLSNYFFYYIEPGTKQHPQFTLPLSPYFKPILKTSRNSTLFRLEGTQPRDPELHPQLCVPVTETECNNEKAITEQEDSYQMPTFLI